MFNSKLRNEEEGMLIPNFGESAVEFCPMTEPVAPASDREEVEQRLLSMTGVWKGARAPPNPKICGG